MRFLRTVSTQRLLAIVAGLIIAAAGGTAIAVAASGGGAVPPRESLAKALHQAAAAPAVSGISARIKFTNNLIDSTNIQGSDPILNGASGRLWLSTTGHRMRLELQGESGDAQVVIDKGSYSIYDPTSNTVYKGTLPASSDKGTKSEPIPTVAQIQSDLNQLMQNVNVVGPIPRNVAGQPAYKVTISPKHDGGLLGDVQLAWDAAHGVPLGIAIYSRNSSTPVLEIKATDISYGRVKSGDLTIKAPAGAKTVRVSPSADRSHARGNGKAKRHADVTGPAAVQSHLPFTLAAPAKLVGLPRQSVQLLDWGGQPAALVTYGQGLGGIAVIEQSAQGQPQQSRAGGDHAGLALPTVSINGHSGQELATALGTVIRVSSGAVDYTVLGSVPPAAAEAAAKELAP
jgi:outer membrane lipoprotein-sorting protein